MFSNIGEYKPCGIFTIGHFNLILITIIGIFIALKKTANKNKEQVYKIIKNITIIACILEIGKIAYNIKQNSFSAVNTYLPLYYCSILLYAGLLSSFAKGTLKRVGDVSLATGSIIGGIVFMIYPSTSLPIYPAFHILSIHSFLFHGTMVYLGILINKIKYVELIKSDVKYFTRSTMVAYLINNYLKKSDVKYFASLIMCMSIVALIVNKLFNGNLMFISNNFPGTPIEALYKMTNGGFLFTIIMIALQMTIPFYISYYIIKVVQYLENNTKFKENNTNKNNNELKVEEKYEIKV